MDRGGSALTLSLAYLFSSLFILIFGILFFVVGILFFETKLQAKFSKETLLNLSDQYFEIVIENGNNNQEIKIEFSNLESFKTTNSSKDNSIIVKMQLKDSNFYKWVFMEDKKVNKEVNISNELFKNVNIFNKQHPDEKIGLIPNFFATRKGLFYIIFLGIITAYILMLQILLNPKSLLFTGIFVFIFYIVIIQQRKNDLEQIKRLE